MKSFRFIRLIRPLGQLRPFKAFKALLALPALSALMALSAISAITACQDSPKYHIGVSQCSEDDWRALLNLEIDREVRFQGDMDVEVVSANDDSRRQISDIERFISDGKDLIIVAPNVAEDVRPVIEKAYDKGIPVILIDRRTTGKKYTAFVGANNLAIGKNIRNYLEEQCGGATKNVIELRGLDGSSPAIERHNGFSPTPALPGKGGRLNILASVSAKWNEKDAELATDSLLRIYPDIDFIYAHNDRMALGAYNAVKKAGKTDYIKIIGVDALIFDGGGVDMVLDGKLLASHLYPTGGSEAIQLAKKILHGEPFDSETELPAVLIDKSNARVMKLQYRAMRQQDEKYLKLEKLTDRQLEKINQQQWMLGGAITIVVLLVLLILSQYRVKKEKEQTDDLLMMQMTTTPLQPSPQGEGALEVPSTGDVIGQSDISSPSPCGEGRGGVAFISQVQSIIIAHIGDSDFSVNDIADELGMSRVQLYRKIKAQSDKNVNELIRNARLEKAKELLKDANKTVSEVAYAVGFSSPSYFTKCFKDQFGVSPSEAK